MHSPCVKKCNLRNKICEGCIRTIDEIVNWKNMPESQHLKVINEIKGNISTHNCPECGGPAYCAMEDGKSANLCWCMNIKPKEKYDNIHNECLCRICLKEK